MRTRDWLRQNRPDLNVGTRGPLSTEARLAWLETDEGLADTLKQITTGWPWQSSAANLTQQQDQR